MGPGGSPSCYSDLPPPTFSVTDNTVPPTSTDWSIGNESSPVGAFQRLDRRACAVTAYADDGQTQPANVQRTSFNEYKYNNYYAQDDAAASPSDEAPPRRPPPATTVPRRRSRACPAPASTGNSAGHSSLHVRIALGRLPPCFTQCVQDQLTLGGLLDPACCELGKPCLLIDHFPCMKECHKVNMAGWIDQSYTWNPQNPSQRLQRPRDLDRPFEFVRIEPGILLHRETGGQ